MDERTTIGLLVIGLGAGVIVIGLLILSGSLFWFGRLPGDIRIEGDNTRIYVPITSMILISIALSIVAALVRRFN